MNINIKIQINDIILWVFRFNYKIYHFNITCYKLKVSRRKLKIYNIEGNPTIHFSLMSFNSFFKFFIIFS